MRQCRYKEQRTSKRLTSDLRSVRRKHSQFLGGQERNQRTSSLHTFFVVSALKSSLLCLLTTHDAAGSGLISCAKMKEHREMSRLVSRSQAKRSIVKLVAAM